jgi:hypothetical protein
LLLLAIFFNSLGSIQRLISFLCNSTMIQFCILISGNVLRNWILIFAVLNLSFDFHSRHFAFRGRFGEPPRRLNACGVSPCPVLPQESRAFRSNQQSAKIQPKYLITAFTYILVWVHEGICLWFLFSL